MKHPTLTHFKHFSSLLTDLRSTPVENVRQITPFYAKQSQFYAFLALKRGFHEKTNPIQTQFKANKAKNKPNLSQNKPNSKPISMKNKPKITNNQLSLIDNQLRKQAQSVFCILCKKSSTSLAASQRFAVDKLIRKRRSSLSIRIKKVDS